ncbi:MAG: GNAT family N-acetyltransferase [Flavobacteriales bacterium]|nr:GNAT family N-acetyltransferase [Flavobacteriales bacterium]
MQGRMITIKPLEAGALKAAAALTPEEPEALGRLNWHLHTPYARAVGAWVEEELTGYALAIGHAHSAHGTDLVVPPHWMGEGVGTALVQVLLAEMERNGATAQVVLAPTESAGFFERFGFRAEGDFIRYTGGRHVQAALQEVVSVAPEHWLGIGHLDRRATGEDRSRWLREHDYLAKVWLELGRVRGFLLPLAGNGLIIADAPYIGLELQRWLLPVRDHITLPAGQEQVHAHLVKQGYVPEPHAVRLVRGAPLPRRPEMVYGW